MKVELDENIPENEAHFKDRDGNVIFKMINMGIHMDNFIKMCAHPLIQGGWEPKVGDWTDKGVIVKITLSFKKTFYYAQIEHYAAIYDKEDLTHLPGIRQLMGMVKHPDDSTDFPLFKYFYDWYNDTDLLALKRKGITQGKELWLCYVMHELHNLKWEDEKWIKRKKKGF